MVASRPRRPIPTTAAADPAVKLANARGRFWIALLVSPVMAHSSTQAVIGVFTRISSLEQSVLSLELRAGEVQRRSDRDIDHLRAALRACPCR